MKSIKINQETLILKVLNLFENTLYTKLNDIIILFLEFKELFPKVHKKQLYKTPTQNQKEPKQKKKVSKKLTKEEL